MTELLCALCNKIISKVESPFRDLCHSCFLDITKLKKNNIKKDYEKKQRIRKYIKPTGTGHFHGSFELKCSICGNPNVFPMAWQISEPLLCKDCFEAKEAEKNGFFEGD